MWQAKKTEPEADNFLGSITLEAAELAKVEKVRIGELKFLKDSPDDLAAVEAVFAACDADGNGARPASCARHGTGYH